MQQTMKEQKKRNEQTNENEWKKNVHVQKKNVHVQKKNVHVQKKIFECKLKISFQSLLAKKNEVIWSVPVDSTACLKHSLVNMHSRWSTCIQRLFSIRLLLSIRMEWISSLLSSGFSPVLATFKHYLKTFYFALCSFVGLNNLFWSNLH